VQQQGFLLLITLIGIFILKGGVMRISLFNIDKVLKGEQTMFFRDIPIAKNKQIKFGSKLQISQIYSMKHYATGEVIGINNFCIINTTKNGTTSIDFLIREKPYLNNSLENKSIINNLGYENLNEFLDHLFKNYDYDEFCKKGYLSNLLIYTFKLDRVK